MILLTTYSDFCARPAADEPAEQQRLCTPGQRALTLLLGTNGMAFQPHMASIESNLRDRAEKQEPGEKARIESVADQIPWIYPPFQTLAYLGGLAALIYLAWAPLTHRTVETSEPHPRDPDVLPEWSGDSV